MNDKCFIWNTPATVQQMQDRVAVVNSARAGGYYAIPRDAQLLLENKEKQSDFEEKKNSELAKQHGFEERPRDLDRFRTRLTTWLLEKRRMGEEYPEITKETIKDIDRIPNISIAERADKLLQYIGRKTPYLGESVFIPTSFGRGKYESDYLGIIYPVLAQSECINMGEVSFLLDYLIDQNWIKRPSQDMEDHILTASGYAHLDDLKKVVVDSSQAFVAMWFDESMRQVFKEGIEPGIKDAGYDAFRIDHKEFSNKIDDEIIAEIRRSRFLVADFTHGEKGGMRGGVYYEAGFAHGLNMPVIFTCRDDMLDKIHFDTRQYNHITWENPQELRERLTRRISADADIERGPRRT